MAILFFPACSTPVMEEKPTPPILLMEVNREWQSTAQCVVHEMDERSKTGVLHMPSSNAIRPDILAKEAFITIRTASDMNTLYTMTVKETGIGASVVTATPYRGLVRNAYTDVLEVAMRDAVTHCATVQ